MVGRRSFSAFDRPLGFCHLDVHGCCRRPANLNFAQVRIPRTVPNPSCKDAGGGYDSESRGWVAGRKPKTHIRLPRAARPAFSALWCSGVCSWVAMFRGIPVANAGGQRGSTALFALIAYAQAVEKFEHLRLVTEQLRYALRLVVGDRLCGCDPPK